MLTEAAAVFEGRGSLSLGGLYVVTAVITGYWALRLMFLPLNGGAQSWWPTIMLGASILLLGGGMHVVVPQVRGSG